jgi:Mg/Co/Ni transporter MgtE
MTTKVARPTHRKVTVSLPIDLIDRLHELIPARQRSRFIADAIEERVAVTEQLAVLEETAGAWSDKNHPDLNSPEAVEQWVRDLRKSWDRPILTDDE